MDRIYSLTDLARRTSEIVDTTLVSGQPAVVAGRGRGDLVLLARDEYEGLLHALDEMKRPDWERTWMRANREAEAGKSKPWSDVKRIQAKRRARPK
jgi:PHD/YefM family antitoxin component YafN of YafNO toxin-antitoxin module